MSHQIVSLITGAAQGIGAATAKRLALAGHNLALHYHSNTEKAQQTANECEKLGATVMLLQGDISHPEDCQQIVASAVEKFGQIDLLVNNAGFGGFNKTHINDLESLSLDTFAQIFNTNVLGALAMSQSASVTMKQRGRGVIINISSTAGISGMTNTSIIYAASKGALNTLTLSLARILAPTIRVNAVCPGFVDSTWWEKCYSDPTEKNKFVQEVSKQSLLGKAVTPEDIANAVAFVFENPSINGELLKIDCGGRL
jgi:3-oxoacyl-[acyl-carrier protein] reductase